MVRLNVAEVHRKPLLFGHAERAYHLTNLIKHFLQFERLSGNRVLSAFDAAHIQNIVDDMKQMAG